MAGKKQHTIPQFLLRGFTSKTLRNKRNQTQFAWIYRKGREAIEVKVADIARKDNFYGPSEPNSVDAKITDRETLIYARLLARFRRTTIDTCIDDPHLCEFLAHLIARSKYIRDLFSDVSTALLNGVINLIGEPERLAPWLERTMADNPEFVKSQLREFFDAEMAELLFELMPKTISADDVANEAQRLREIGERMKDVISPSVKKGQLSGLSKGFAPSRLVESLEGLHWSVRHSGIPLILGDFGCLIENEGPQRFSPMPYEGVQIVGACLPISAFSAIVGTENELARLAEPDAINREMAACSREFFVSDRRTAEVDELHKLIGAKSFVNAFGDIDEVITQITAPPKL